MSDRPEDDRPLVDELREQGVDDLPDETPASIAGGEADREARGDTYEERERREGGTP
jgi:hypothetical protein